MDAKNITQFAIMQTHIAACKASGITVEAYCRNHQLKPSVYYYWRKKLQPEKPGKFISITSLLSTAPVRIKIVREEMGLDNVVVMVPFCRTVEELIKVRDVMGEYGLKRGEQKLEVYLMAEIPSNILLADEFARHIDSFSIGSNLTQLVLGLDRNSSLVAHLYDERNPAVKKMISSLIQSAKNNNVKVGICGQGPSDFPDFAQFLVEEGIDTISVTPDSFLKTVRAIAKIEGSKEH